LEDLERYGDFATVIKSATDVIFGRMRGSGTISINHGPPDIPSICMSAFQLRPTDSCGSLR
jgi:hypothetical protein